MPSHGSPGKGNKAMRGIVTDYDEDRGAGAVRGEDGIRYPFTGGDWKGSTPPDQGIEVDFFPEDEVATRVFPVAGAVPTFRWKWFLLSIGGRIPRSWFWLRYSLPWFVLWAIFSYVDRSIGTYDVEVEIGALESVFILVTLWPSIAVGVKRCHDRDKTGWWYLLVLMPLIGYLWWLIELGMLRGTRGPNRFGMDPTPAG